MSILGFLKKEYVNEKGELTKTDKHNFALQKLKVFTECNGKKYDGKNAINDFLQKKITDYLIRIRVIDSKLNPQYSPEQNFKRLNESINNLKEDTYRMWNVDCDKFVMRKINDVTAKYIGKLFPTVHDSKKRFESIVTLCIYHEFQNHKQNYKERNWRKVSKKDITIWLNAISDKNRENYEDAILRTDNILLNIEEWLSFIDIPLYEIVRTGKYQITEKKVSLLYYFLSNIKLEDLKRHSNQIQILLKEFYTQYTAQQKNKDFDMQLLINETKANLKMICYGVKQGKILV